MKKYNILIITVAFSLLIFNLSFAARPLATDDTGTVAQGKWELEGGYTSSTLTVNSRTIGGALKYGFSDNFYLGFGSSIQSTGGTSTNGPIEVEGKLSLNDTYGIKANLAGSDSLSITGLMTGALNSMTYYINLGMISGSGNSGTFMGAALEIGMNKDINFVCELTRTGIAGATSLSGLLGGQWQIKDNMVVDLGIGLALNDITPRTLTIGFAIEL